MTRSPPISVPEVTFAIAKLGAVDANEPESVWREPYDLLVNAGAITASEWKNFDLMKLLLAIPVVLISLNVAWAQTPGSGYAIAWFLVGIATCAASMFLLDAIVTAAAQRFIPLFSLLDEMEDARWEFDFRRLLNEAEAADHDPA